MNTRNGLEVTEALRGTGDDVVDEAVVAQFLVELGLTAEVEKKTVMEKIKKLRHLTRLVTVARMTVGLDLATLRQALGTGEAERGLLGQIPLMADDPARAEVLQGQVLEGLLARERLHRLSVLEPLLGASLGLSELGALDERLRVLMPALWVIGPERSYWAAGLPAEVAAKHWWLTEAAVPGPEMSTEGEATPEALRAWISQRVLRRADGATLRLSAEEARTLLSDEPGRKLAEYLGDKLDLHAIVEEANACPPPAGELLGEPLPKE